MDKLAINRVIRHLVISDFFLNLAFGLLAPIFAVFILQGIEGSSLRVIGLATAFYWIARTATTVPLSRLMDRLNGERDEYYFVVAGSFMMSTLPLFFIISSLPWHIYLIQLLMGFANSMAVPGWRILFTDHIDRGRTGYEWSLEDIAIGTSVGGGAYLGSIIADKFGFELVFILLAILGYLATAVFLVPLKKDAKTLFQLKSSGKWSEIQEKRETFPPVIKSDGVQ